MTTAPLTPETLTTVGELAIATAALDASARKLEQEFSAVKTDIIAMLRQDVDYLRAEVARERALRVEATTALRAATRLAV